MEETPREFLRACLTACANDINPADAFTIPDLERFTQIELLTEFVSVGMGLVSIVGATNNKTDHEVLTMLYDLIEQQERGGG